MTDDEEKPRHCWLGVPELYRLDSACARLQALYPFQVYLVGSVLERRTYRDVDIRLLISDKKYGHHTHHEWMFLNAAISDQLAPAPPPACTDTPTPTSDHRSSTRSQTPEPPRPPPPVRESRTLMSNHNTHHAPSGDFQRTLQNAINDEEAANLRAAGLTFREIAERQGTSLSTAKDRVDRALKNALVEGVKELRVVSLLDLMAQKRKLWTIAEENHYHPRRIYQGQPIGDQVIDRAPNIAALRELRQVNESIRKLMGTDAPAEVRMIVSDDSVAEIERLALELGLNDVERAEVMS